MSPRYPCTWEMTSYIFLVVWELQEKGSRRQETDVGNNDWKIEWFCVAASRGRQTSGRTDTAWLFADVPWIFPSIMITRRVWVRAKVLGLACGKVLNAR